MCTATAIRSFIGTNSRTRPILTGAVIRNENVGNALKEESPVIVYPLCSFPCAYLCSSGPKWRFINGLQLATISGTLTSWPSRLKYRRCDTDSLFAARPPSHLHSALSLIYETGVRSKRKGKKKKKRKREREREERKGKSTLYERARMRNGAFYIL